MNNTLKELVSAGQTKVNSEAAETRQRLEKCWPYDVNWDLYPKRLYLVSLIPLHIGVSHWKYYSSASNGLTVQKV